MRMFNINKQRAIIARVARVSNAIADMFDALRDDARVVDVICADIASDTRYVIVERNDVERVYAIREITHDALRDALNA